MANQKKNKAPQPDILEPKWKTVEKVVALLEQSISPEARVEVEGSETDELSLVVILTIPSDDPSAMTANLRGPLLMNPRTRRCKQLVLTEDYPTRYPVFSAQAQSERGRIVTVAEAIPA